MDAADLVLKLTKKVAESNAKKVTKNTIFGDFLPTSEGQIRPLQKLKNDAEKIHVWEAVIESGEKITAALVEAKVYEFLESGEVIESSIGFNYEEEPAGNTE